MISKQKIVCLTSLILSLPYVCLCVSLNHTRISVCTHRMAATVPPEVILNNFSSDESRPSDLSEPLETTTAAMFSYNITRLDVPARHRQLLFADVLVMAWIPGSLCTTQLEERSCPRCCLLSFCGCEKFIYQGKTSRSVIFVHRTATPPRICH